MISIEGLIVNINGIKRGRIEIDPLTGLISKVSEPTGQADVVLKDELIFPGFIDLHVHAREDVSHAQDYKEDFVTAGAAAINGGVVMFAEMPNNPKPPIDDKSYEEKYQLAKKSAVDILLYAGIGPGTKPLAKKIPYKTFMGPSVGNLFFISQQQLEETIKNYTGQAVSFHCEDPEILDQHKDEFTHEQKRPPEAEISAIDFAIMLIEKYNLKGKICHLSTKVGLQKIVEAKKRGVAVTCEITPHHLYFNQSAHLQMNPPLRSSDDNQFLIEALRKGDIDFLATDHAPHTVEEKEKGISGLPLLDTYGPFVTWLMAEHNFTPADVLRLCSYNPGEFVNQFVSDKYGKIAEGYAGSLTVINPNLPIVIEKSKLKTKAGWSPFEGMQFPGSVVMTVVKGKTYKNL